jgi:hypothetical protein
MGENENVRNRPRIELTVRKNASLTGVPLCPACGKELPPDAKFCGSCGYCVGTPVPPPSPAGGNTPPRVVMTKEHHNRGRGSFFDVILRIVIIIVLLILASLLVLYVRDQYSAAEGRPETITPTNAPTFAAACRQLANDVLAPLDATTPPAAAALPRLRDRARAAAGQADTAQLGKLALDFCDRLAPAQVRRGEAKQEEIVVLNRPPPTLSPDPAEQKRVREFRYRELGRRWNDYASSQREPLNRLLAEMEREERKVAAPRRIDYPSSWDRLLKALHIKKDDQPGS